jgi:hypothetical protein
LTPKDHYEEDHAQELIELLNELRVALPGVQVLFAFMLTVPFSSRFGELTTGQRAVFVAAFLSTALATILFLAPTAFHRIRFRSGDEEALLRMGNRAAIGGLALLSFALSAVVFLVADVVGSLPLAIVATAGIGTPAAVLWFLIPILRGRVGDRRSS